MDAALKRSRSEEPAELPPPAREVDEKEEEEEERMEQGLEEEEEEVDPRIQVGRVRDAHGPHLPGTAAGSRRLSGHPLCIPAWRPLRSRSGTEAWEYPPPRFHGLPAGGGSACVDAA